MTPGENTQSADSAEAPVPSEAGALCIIRNMTSGPAHSSKALPTGSSMPKVTLTLPATTTATELMEAVGRHFQYTPDSFELLLQRVTDGDCVSVHTCGDKSLAEIGFHTDGTTRNVLVMYDRDREPPKRLMGPEPDEGASSSSAASDWIRNTRGAAGESKYYPADTREPAGYVGLVNQAMTCYLNSLLQTLYMTPEFRNALYRWEFDGTEQDAAKSIPFQLQKLFLLLQTSSKPAIGTTDLTTSFGWDSSEAWQQHDVQELCRVMFDALEHKFKHTDQAKLICQLYEGKLKDYVKCLQCGYESAREDTFLDIPLVVRPFGSNQAYGSVEEALRAFVTPETLDGCNQYSCERCNRKCDAHKGLKFVRFPYLLTLQLKRFDFDPATMHRIKLNDKVTFPEILDLNQFLRSESDTESPSDDADTTDSGSALDEEAAVTSTSSGPGSSRQANGPCEDMGSDDEGIDVGGGSNADAAANARNLKRAASTGPYMYELFSIMVHSGSASGGHYYAYIKSFTENQWYCFNDAQVSRVTYDEIRKTYGGGPSRGGYYISTYASSTNAYMLMYRQVDKQQNAVPMTPDQFPEHLKLLLEGMQEAEELERQQKELDRSMCKIKLFCHHPRKHTLQEMRLKVHKDATLEEATQIAHQIMGLEGVVPLECCRLVMYDDCSESLECSLEEVAHQTMGQVLGGVKSTYPFDLLLETRKLNETFQPYKIGGTTVKVHVVNLEANEIARAVVVRGLKTQTVEEFKAQVAQQLGLPSSNMRMVLENYHNSLELLAAPGRMLKSEGFGKSNTVFIEYLDEEDAKLHFRESRFFEILDRHINTIVISVHLPPEEEVLREKQRISSGAESEQRSSNIEDEGGTVPVRSTQQTQTSNTALSDGYDSDLCDSSSSGNRGGDHSEDSSLTDSERTLVGDDMSPRNNSPDIANADDGCCSGEERQPKHVPSVEMTDQIKRSMLEPSGSTPAATPATTPAAGADGAGLSEEASGYACGDAASQAQAAAAKPEPRRYFRAWPYTDKEDGSRRLRVYIDKRITFGALKKELEPHVGIDSSHFKVFRVYSNNQEFECTKLCDNLISYAEDTKLVIKLGRALKPGEHRIEIYLLSPNAPEPSKFLLDWIFTQGMTVLQIKQEILHKIRERCVRDIPLNRCRLRKKASGNPGSVYLDTDRLDGEATMFMSHKVFLEILSEPEKVVSANSLVLFVRRWRPSTFTFDPLEEVILNERTVGALKDELSKLSGLDPSVIEVAKCPGQFPCLVSSLTVHNEMDWHGSAPSLTSWPLYISEDGLVVLYRDRTEALKELTEEEKQEISSRENVRAPKGAKAVPSPRKERALKIYTGSPPNDSGALSSDTKPSLNSVPIDLD